MYPLSEIVEVELTDPEWFMLNRGLAEWGGPARCTDAMANAMGFGDVERMFVEMDWLYKITKQHRPMSRWDWARTLLATEIVFASSVIGSGGDWLATTGLDEVESFTTLRSLQRKLMRIIVRDVMREEEIGRDDPAAAAAELTRWPR
jgi:hypothetical protein